MAEDEARGRAIFISYRRDDSEGEAGRLFDDLVRAYGEDSVFMDVAGIQPGLDFRKSIDENVTTCGVLLAMVGPQWTTITDSSGARRLDNSNDFVRLEIGEALKRNIAVIPVLVHGAAMPHANDLPDDLKDLAYRNSVELTHARWNSDVALLIDALKSYVNVTKKSETEPVHAAVPVQLPPPQTAAEPLGATPKKSRLPLWLGGAAVVVVAGAGIGYFTLHGSEQAPAPQPQQTAGQQPATTTPPAAQPATSGVATLVGTWANTVENKPNDSLYKIRVSSNGSRLRVNAWGKCKTGLCDWGSQQADFDGVQAVTGTYQPRFTPQETQGQRAVTLALQPAPNGLQVTVRNDVSSSARKRTAAEPLHFLFVRTAE